MKKFIWKIRYAAYMRRRTLCSWVFCWQMACIAIDEMPHDWKDCTPIEMVDSELSYWSEDF